MFAANIAIALAALSLITAVAGEKNCTQSNGYKYTVCGKGLKDANQLCCKALEKCVQVKPFSGDDKVVCSEERQLTSVKAVKVVIIPLFFLLMDVALIVYLVLRCNIKESLVTKIGVATIALAWPFLFSKFWTFGVYTALLATMFVVAGAPSIDCPRMPYWTYRFIWFLGLFQIIALFGPTEAFHVPIFAKSKAANTEFIKNVYNQADCNTYFEKYFKILSIEKEEKEANPDREHFSYCSNEWLATVQSFAVVQSLLWMGLVLVSARSLLAEGNGGFFSGSKVSDDDVKPINA